VKEEVIARYGEIHYCMSITLLKVLERREKEGPRCYQNHGSIYLLLMICFSNSPETITEKKEKVSMTGEVGD
jgi:hypothetical protein